MLFIDSLVRHLIPSWNEQTNLSIACVSTTNPVYLVFQEYSTHPALVVRMANSEGVRKTHGITEQLFEQVGNLIPKPIALSHFGDQSFAVQEGAKGTPWFQLCQNISTVDQWDELRARALDALSQLQKGSSAIQEWQTKFSPGEELRDCFEKCTDTKIILPSGIEKQVATMSDNLDKLGEITSFPQHGDYCLNNLIIDNETINVIDFEDFGMTSMPLHDEFSLALSMYALAPSSINTTLLHELTTCTIQRVDIVGINKTMVPSLFLYHLLLRLGEWSLSPQRKRHRAWLLSILETFVEDPFSFFNSKKE